MLFRSAETGAEEEQAAPGDEIVEQPSASMAVAEDVVVPPPPSSEAEPVQQDDVSHFFASPEEFVMLSRDLSMTSILNEPLQEAFIPQPADGESVAGTELTLGVNPDVPPEA